MGTTNVNVLYCYNGFADFTTTFDGKVFRFPEDKVTTIYEHNSTAPDERRRNHESHADPTAVLEKTYSPNEMVEMVLMRNGENLITDGCMYVGTEAPSNEIKALCREQGRLKKIHKIEEAQAERNATKQRGGIPRLDNTIVKWMKELDISDEAYNRKEEKTDVEKLASALVGAMQTAAPQAQQPRK